MKPSNTDKKLVKREYTVNGVVHQAPDLESIPIMWDFEDARYHKFPELAHNLKTDNTPDVPPKWCPYYDAHFFMVSVIDIFADLNDGVVPLEIIEWVLSMFPEDAIPPRVRDDSELPSVRERGEQLTQYEYIEQFVIGQTLPDEIHARLHAYWETTWPDADDEINQYSEGDNVEEEDPGSYYGDGDNYYDNLKR